MVPFESVMSVSYYLPIVTKALSLTVFAEPSNVTDRRTDGRTDRRTELFWLSRPDAACYALASVAKICISLCRKRIRGALMALDRCDVILVYYYDKCIKL